MSMFLLSMFFTTVYFSKQADFEFAEDLMHSVLLMVELYCYEFVFPLL